MSRRSDNTLRIAISEIERLVFSNPDTDAVLLKVLNQLMLLLGAGFGYVYRCKPSEDESIPWELLGCLQHSGDGFIKEIKNSCASFEVPPVLKPLYLSGRCLSSVTTSQAIEPLPHYHPEIENYFCIPLVDARSIYSVVYLCNTPTGFDERTEGRIRPLLAAASCIVRASEQQKSRQDTDRSTAQKVVIPHSIDATISAMFDAVIIFGFDEKIIAHNQAASDLLDPDNQSLIGVELKSIFPKGAPRLTHRLLDDPLYMGTSIQQDNDNKPKLNTKMLWKGIEAKKLGGEKVLFDMSSFKFSHSGRLLKGLVFGNISDDLDQTSDYHNILQRFQALTHMVPVGILQLNRQWDCVYVNDTFCEYCHMSPEELQKDGWLEALYPEDVSSAVVNLRTKAVLTGNYSDSFRLQSPLGKVTWVQVSASPLYDENGILDGLILTFNDITEQLNNAKRLQDIADKDPLTGLTNRALFNDRLNIALKGVDRFGMVALLFLDLDEFKSVNDTFGHPAGDQLLKQVALRLDAAVRRADTIARIGGDEFTLLLTNIEHEIAVTAVADKLIQSFSEPFILGEHSIYITCSIGLVVTDTSDVELKTFLKQADIALYKAKESGRNQYKFYTKELDAGVDVYMQLKQSLKKSAKSDFHIVYQPQLDARTGNIIGLEALTRWTGSDEPVGPEVFMKIIENSALIDDFSEWLFTTVFDQVKQWDEQFGLSRYFSVSINLSAKQFRNKELATVIHRSCLAYGIAPESIILEMTETAIIEDPKLAASTLSTLSELGFELSLDDFGTGYSSLAYLRSMPFTSVKIDKSFIQDVLNDGDDAKIVSAIIGLSKQLRLKVIAEGVSSDLIKTWLLENDCYIHQGFYFYKPLRADAVKALLMANLAQFGGSSVLDYTIKPGSNEGMVELL